MDSYIFAPSLLLVTDHVDRGDGETLVRGAGGRMRDAVSLADAAGWLDDNAPVDAIWLDVARDHGTSLDALLDRVDGDARCGRHTGLVSVPFGLVDAAAARLSAREITLLADPDPAEIAAALALALRKPAVAPHLSERDGDPTRLRQISEEVGRIARTLAELSGAGADRSVKEPLSPFRLPPPEPLTEEAGFEMRPSLVRAMIRGRRLRDQFFDSQLFADPAWDMLLDLAAARLEGRQVAVSSLCIAAAVPATTALRWIKTLVDEGLFLRTADPRDGRRVFIELSDAAQEGVRAYFRALSRSGIAIC